MEMHAPRESSPHEAPSPAVEFTVVIVSHNTVDLLRECLRTLDEESRRASFQVVVVDNASSDGSADMVRREFPRVLLHANHVNVGYSRAVNQAAREAAGRYFLVLNPDIRVQPGSLGVLVDFMDRNPRVGVAGGRLLNPDGSLQYSCRSFYTLRTLLYRRTFLGRLFPRSRVIRDHLMADWDHGSDREVDWVLGACMMVRREAVREVGLMDERFFLYFEDVDWCYRMKRRGWSVWYVTGAEMVHHHRRESARGGLADPRFLNHLASVFHFYEKWNGALLTLKRHRGPVRLLLLVASDLVAVNLAFFTAYLLRLLLGHVLVKPLFPIVTYRFFLAFVNATTLFAFYAFGLYQPRLGAGGRGEEIVRLARAVAASFLILMTGTFLLAQANLYSRSMVYAFWPIAGVYAAAGRLGIRRMHERLRAQQFDMRRTLLVGSGRALAGVEEELAARPELGYDVVGVVGWERTAHLERWIRAEQVEEVILAAEGIPPERLAAMILECRRLGVVTTALSGASELVALGARVTPLADGEALTFPEATLQTFERATRRGLDLLAASVGLVLVVPAISAGRFLTRGPGGGRTARVPVIGRGGREFEMRLFAPRGEGPSPASALHQGTCDDFTPAFWNVLRGEMSLVGPRPRAASEDPPEGEWGALLLAERPGLTGLWRIHASRGELDPARDPDRERRRLDELDRRYLRNRSLSFDLQILIETLLGGRKS